VVADAGLPAVQALIRWDPVTHAERELAERQQLRFPPAARMAAVTGQALGVEELLAAATLPADADVLGPVPQGGDGPPSGGPPPGGHGDSTGDGAGAASPGLVRMLIRVPRPAGPALASALHSAQAVRSARKDTAPARVQLDPADLI
jgi:primosomal protein N' (replication factor Y)